MREPTSQGIAKTLLTQHVQADHDPVAPQRVGQIKPLRDTVRSSITPSLRRQQIGLFGIQQVGCSLDPRAGQGVALNLGIVSPAGTMVGRILDGSVYRLAMAIPEQSHTLAELAGNWSAVSSNGNNGVFSGATINYTLDATGAVTASFCGGVASWDVSSCTSIPAGTLSLKAHADGGFEAYDNGQLGGRVFAYQSGGGDLMLVEVDSDGSFTLSTKQWTHSSPTVGDVKTHWSLSMDAAQLSNLAVSADTNTIMSVDAAAGSWVRKQKTVGGTDEHLQTWFLNNPRNGYSYRAAGSALASDGATVNINQTTSMGLRGMGSPAF